MRKNYSNIGKSTLASAYPLPVRPTTPHLSPGRKLKDTELSARGRSSRYLRQTLSNFSSPCSGHASSSWIDDSPASCGSSDVARTRSMAVMRASASVKRCSKKPSELLKMILQMIRNPTKPDGSCSTSFPIITIKQQAKVISDPKSSMRRASHLWEAS